MRDLALPRTTAPVWRGAAALAVLALAGWLAIEAAAPPPQRQAAPPPVAATSAVAPRRLLAAPASAAVAAAPPVAAPSLRATPAAGSAAPPATLAADEAEVCGLGVVHVDDEEPLALNRIPGGVRALARQRLALAMATSGDERMRAAGHLLTVRLALTADALTAAVEADAACRRAVALGLEETARFCVDEQARSQAALLEPVAAAVDQLARMAATSGDPLVHAFAYEACNPAGLSFIARDGNCQLVSAERWSRQAPDDAAPWLQLAAQAFARGDTAAATAALARAAQAPGLVASGGALAALAAAALPEGMPMLERTAMQAELARVDAGTAPGGLAAIATACNEAALAEPGRHALCEDLAGLLIERSRSAAAVTAGVQLGERLGWPATRTSAVLRAQRAAQEAALRFTQAPQALACDSLRRQRELALLTGRLGELGAGQELLRRGGGPAGP